MPELELVSHALCPYVQRAVIALTEKDVPFTRTVIDLDNRPDWFKAISPLGKVPLLKVKDEALFESAAIVDYLDETLAPRLHPADPLQRAKHRAFIEFASTVLADIWGLYTAKDRAGYDARLAVLEGRFARLEESLGAGPYFSGPDFSLVDAAFGPVFRYFDVFERHVNISLFVGKPRVARWRKALAARQSVRDAVAPDYTERLVAFVRAQDGFLGRLIAVEQAEPAFA